MGLDITAYSGLKPVGRHVEDWCDDYEHHVQAYSYTDFPQSFRGVPVLAERRGFLEGGCFAITDATQSHRFRAGSYSGYNAWRESLQAQFNPGREPGKPFYELIWFADNEGCIGPDAAADLLEDFRAFEAAWRQPYENWDTYQDWARACELAADHGLISFR